MLQLQQCHCKVHSDVDTGNFCLCWGFSESELPSHAITHVSRHGLLQNISTQAGETNIVSQNKITQLAM